MPFQELSIRRLEEPYSREILLHNVDAIRILLQHLDDFPEKGICLPIIHEELLFFLHTGERLELRDEV
jgi:hypothetical protein